jgi:hypothetical protein
MMDNKVTTLSIPDRAKVHGSFDCKQMKTNAHLFWFLIGNGDLEVASRRNGSDFIPVAANVSMFDTIACSAVFMTNDGNLKLASFNTKNSVQWIYKVNIDTNISCFLLTPHLKSMWVINSEQQLFSRGNAFILPSNNDDQENTSEQQSSTFI